MSKFVACKQVDSEIGVHSPHSLRSRALLSFLPRITMAFQVEGSELPSDHGYALFAALSHFQTKIHSLDCISIQLINGTYKGNGIITLGETSYLKIRMPIELESLFCLLEGQKLDIEKYQIQLVASSTVRLFTLSLRYY